MTLAAAQAGDEQAFEALVAGHRREFTRHCYRMLGSLDDADEAVQEPLLAAWRGLATFEGRSSGGTWLDDTNREISRVYNLLPKVVVSDTYSVPADNAWQHQTTVVPRAGVRGWLQSARTEEAGDILVFGSRTMWNGLLQQGLVDELHLMVSPNAVGSGTPILDSAVDLDLLETRRFPGSSNVLLRYAVSRNDSRA